MTGESTLTDMSQPTVITKQSSTVHFDDWQLLDCCFGIPLFDAKLNKDICSKILDHNLLNPDRLVNIGYRHFENVGLEKRVYREGCGFVA